MKYVYLGISYFLYGLLLLPMAVLYIIHYGAEYLVGIIRKPFEYFHRKYQNILEGESRE